MLKRIISACCVFIITFFMFFLIIYVFINVRLIDWKKLYPFNDTELVKNNNDDSVAHSRTIISTLSNYKNLILKIEEDRINIFILHIIMAYMPLLEKVRDYEALLGWNLNRNADPDYRIALDLGNGFFIPEKYLNPKLDITPNVQGLNDLNNFLGTRGIDFLYVQAPSVLCKYDKQEQLDYSHENIDALLRGLSQSNIQNIDLREHIHNNEVLDIQEERIKHHNYFLRLIYKVCARY
ncbi:hypothetical protein AGMMS50212_13680 [Spirochaetia bacterium]|nr:hypothetical protein AGMMS50212_13680 [Spirochaetia bacterium]